MQQTATEEFGQPQARTETELNQFSQSIFDELQRVKAERDLYYDKLLKVRNRIEQGKGQRLRATADSIRFQNNSGISTSQFDFK